MLYGVLQGGGVMNAVLARSMTQHAELPAAVGSSRTRYWHNPPIQVNFTTATSLYAEILPGKSTAVVSVYPGIRPGACYVAHKCQYALFCVPAILMQVCQCGVWES